MLGFGCSGRPSFVCETVEQIIEFFNTSLEAWLDASGFLKKTKGKIIDIFAHSLGCFITCQFLEHKSLQVGLSVDKLWFMSPACVSGRPQNFSEANFIDSRTSVVGRLGLRIARKCWGTHFAPSRAFKMFGYRWAWFMHRTWMQRI